jgi:hypothetical protein
MRDENRMMIKERWQGIRIQAEVGAGREGRNNCHVS